MTSAIKVDTVGNNFDISGKMMLQISPEMSKLSRYTNTYVDSLINTMSPDEIAANAEKLANGIHPMIILKDYTAGKSHPFQKICPSDWFQYEEPAPEFEWELVDSVTTVLGYECKGARCSFRGREWIVYYCVGDTCYGRAMENFTGFPDWLWPPTMPTGSTHLSA